MCMFIHINAFLNHPKSYVLFSLGEGQFLGAKVIAVVGTLAAKGVTKTHSWLKLNSTAPAGECMCGVLKIVVLIIIKMDEITNHNND